MPRYPWLTDIHLNFLDPPEIEALIESIRRSEPDGVLISGDIGEAHDVLGYLERLDTGLGCPIYFVLGNHDFYRGSIRGVRERVDALCAAQANLHYLTLEDAHPLAAGVGVVGHDGWADGREGNYERSNVMLNDYVLIEELSAGGLPLPAPARRQILEILGDEAADHIERVLPPALARFEHVVVVTHVPPLRDACWHDGRISDDNWAPHFVCRAVGTKLIEIMQAHPERRITVLCGHTHGRGECRPLDNIHILTGGAEYGAPAVQQVFEF